jgi:diguanylate cyclase (GGDEF)-like protein/PAS domain S-box-containing protein
MNNEPMLKERGFSAFLRNLWLTLGGLAFCLVLFVYYVYWEKEIDHANDLRYRSFLLTSELRQSSDDLTRMARTYVVTSKPIYKQHFQEILDIRDGKIPHPLDPANVYWDFVGEGNFRPQSSHGDTTPLLERMRQAGFTEQELAKLVLAKKKSDELTAIEFAAFQMVESAPGNEAVRARASRMLYDEKYHAYKASVMAPISQVYRMMDERTLEVVNHAAKVALVLRYAFIIFVLMFAFLLWRTYRALLLTLGASPDELYTRIAKLGQGEFTTSGFKESTNPNSVLDWVLESEFKLARAEVERKEADQLIKKWSEAFSNAALGIALGDVATNTILEVNKAFSSMIGYSIDELKGRQITSLYPSSERELVLKEITQVLDKDYSRYESRLERKDGSSFPAQIDLATVRNEIGKPAFRVATIQDISWRREAESALRLQSEITLNAASGIVVVKAEDGTIHYANRRFEEMFGYAPGELLGKPVSLINEPTDKSPEETAAEIMTALEKEGRWTGEILNRKKDGSAIWTVANVSTFQHPELGPLLISHQMDITERKRNEKILKDFSKEIEDLYQNAPCGYHSVDAEGKIVRINQTELDWLGYSREEVIGRPITDFFTPASQADIRDIFERFKKEGHLYGVEREVVRKDGTTFPALLNSTAIYDESGTFVRSRSMLTNITVQKKMEQIINDRLLELQTILDESSVAITFVKDRRQVWANKRMTELFGYSAEEMANQPTNMFYLSQHDYETFGANAYPVLLQGGTFKDELMMRHRDGHTIWINISGKAVSPENFSLGSIWVLEDISIRKELEQKLETQAHYDLLTGLNSRAFFNEQAEREISRSKRLRDPLGFLMFDVDHFKYVNDTYGHNAGDAVLRELGKCSLKTLRDIDIIGRWGGEEFVVLLPGISGNQVKNAAERLRMAISEIRVSLEQGVIISFTISIGATWLLESDAKIDNLVKRADKALYAAKHAGRNCVSLDLSMLS